ncbi:hypothetical protein HNP65_001719 [Thermosipho japonicus]|uniref:DUF3242 domain-containing protein n=1 Tax=Thermosipho japonicus TaxID=90323 RepID=A0A841GMN1_9BACT|nr:DUF3242 domain-containing protein [Thermosipho japonicus]MBB6063255.1 hypothetical protein [Thermosipho japonicus]
MGKLLVAIVLVLLIAFSCTLIIKTPSLPGSFSLKSAISLLDSFEYPLVEAGKINSLYGVQLNRGMYGVFKNFDGMFYVFKYEDEKLTKNDWNRLIKTFGSILKINYFKFSLFDRGYLQTKFEDLNVITWWKGNWLFVITGNNSKEFFEYINKVYGMIQ